MNVDEARKNCDIAGFSFDMEAKYKVAPEFMIRGDEAFIFSLPRPLKNGAEILKVWHSNYSCRRGTDGSKVEVPRFLFSNYPQGFHRLFHLYRIAKVLHPKNFIDVLEVDVPENLPFFYNLENPPTDKQGKEDFPVFQSKRVLYANEHLEELRVRNKK